MGQSEFPSDFLFLRASSFLSPFLGFFLTEIKVTGWGDLFPRRTYSMEMKIDPSVGKVLAGPFSIFSLLSPA